MSRKIPYGLSDYKKLAEENYVYVDKTRYIEVLESLNTEYPVFLRPRRFGKSLLVSTLQYYYDIKYAEEFDALFQKTYIGTHKTALANSYYVLRLDFSKLDTDNVQVLKDSFYNSVYSSISFFNKYYLLNIELPTYEKPYIANVLDAFLNEVYLLVGKKVYVMIDEYDHFANGLLSNTDAFNTITGKDGFVRSFYEVFKTHAGNGCIDRIFITGVTSLTLDSLTSGFNIAKNVSMYPALNEMAGFTYEEVKSLLQEINDTDLEETMMILTESYNGYRFHNRSGSKVFNSNLVLYFMDEYQRSKKIPTHLADSNMRSDYHKLTAMFNLFQDEEARREILEKIMNNDNIETDIITNFDLSSPFTEEDFLSLLYYLGLLTIKGEGLMYEVVLQVPNSVIYDIYFQYYANYLNVSTKAKRSAVGLIAFHDDFEELNKLIEDILNLHSDEDYKDFHESRLKSIMLSCFSNQNIFLVKSEYPVEGKRIDIALFDRRRRDRKTKYNYLLEIKYIPKAQAGNARIETIKMQAREQMQEYLQLKEFEEDSRLKGYIYIVVKNKIVCFEEVERK